MKKISILISIVTLIIFFNGCKKNEQNYQSMITKVSSKDFYKISPNTNQIISKAVSLIEKSSRYENLTDYVKKFGFPNWDKSIVQNKNYNTYSRNQGDFNSYLLVPTIKPNESKITGFIAVELNGDSIKFSSKLISNYKQYPYESNNASGITAELILSCYLTLEKEVFDCTKFIVKDNQLSMFKSNNLNEGIAYLELGGNPLITTNARQIICIWERWVYSTYHGDNPLTNWEPIVCWLEGVGALSGSWDDGLGGLGGGGGSNSVGNDEPPATLTDEEICKKNFEDMVSSTVEVDIKRSPQTMSSSSTVLQRPVMIVWTIAENPFGWVVNTYWSGIIKKTNINQPWKWDVFNFDRISIDGFVVGGNVSPTESHSIYIDYLRENAVVNIMANLKFEVGCGGSPFSRTSNISKFTRFKAGNY